jgi:hypothetical protein
VISDLTQTNRWNLLLCRRFLKDWRMQGTHSVLTTRGCFVRRSVYCHMSRSAVQQLWINHTSLWMSNLLLQFVKRVPGSYCASAKRNKVLYMYSLLPINMLWTLLSTKFSCSLAKKYSTMHIDLAENLFRSYLASRIAVRSSIILVVPCDQMHDVDTAFAIVLCPIDISFHSL